MIATASPFEGFTNTPSSGFPLHLLPSGNKGSAAASAPCLDRPVEAGSRGAPGEGVTAFRVTSEAAGDVPAREALLDRAMGPGRKRKSSEKLRRGRKPSEGLAFVTRDGFGALVGTVRLWDVAVGHDGRAGLLLGPLAVDPSVKSAGIGSALMRHAIAEARRLGHGVIVLVGDPEYYARFGFSADRTATLAMPGPFERHRLLALELQDGALDGAAGVLKAAGRKARMAAPTSLAA